MPPDTPVSSALVSRVVCYRLLALWSGYQESDDATTWARSNSPLDDFPVMQEDDWREREDHISLGW